MTPVSDIAAALTRRGRDRPSAVVLKLFAFAWIVIFGALAVMVAGVMTGAIK